MKGKAVVLLSGGLDSSTVLYMALRDGFRVQTISFDYGQKHRCEREAAGRIAERASVEKHIVVSLDERLFRGSSLTGKGHIPRNREMDRIAGSIPSTYVPARNTVFLAMALAYSESIGAHHIFIGVNSVDYSGYPDCRPEYIQAFQNLANLATKESVEGRRVYIHAPLISMNKAEIIAEGISLGVDYSLTRSCYNPDQEGRGCGECDACRLRLKGFRANGLQDPAPYRAER